MSTRSVKIALFVLALVASAGCQPTETAAIPPSEEATRTPIPALPTATSTRSSSVSWTDDFAAFVESNDDFSGAVLVALDDEILLEAAYGMADRSQEIPNRVDTRFNLGSMNKMFTAVAVLQLVEQGRLSLDDRIIDVLPDYPNAEVAEAVTIHHLLTHTSGLGDVFTDEFAADPHRYRTNTDFLALFVDEPLLFAPGDQFSYSNAGFVVLGLIIEQVSGQSYDDYVRENIFEPSGMAATGAFDVDADVPDLAIGYTIYDMWGNETGTLSSHLPLMPGRGFAAGGGYSTVGDLYRFGQALLGYQLLNPEMTELLLTGKVTVNENRQFAYGFIDQINARQRAVGHTGGAPGICSFFWTYPDSGYSIIVLSNSDDGCVPMLIYLRDTPFE